METCTTVGKESPLLVDWAKKTLNVSLVESGCDWSTCSHATYTLPLESMADLRIGRSYGAWRSDIDRRREIVATVFRAAEENALGICGAIYSRAACGASGPNHIKNVVAVAGIDGNLRRRRRDGS